MAEPDLHDFMQHLLFVEQPFARRTALSDDTARIAGLARSPRHDHRRIGRGTAQPARALDCGYAGTSHKNCKGVFKGLANACLLEKRRRRTSPESLPAQRRRSGQCGAGGVAARPGRHGHAGLDARRAQWPPLLCRPQHVPRSVAGNRFWLPIPTSIAHPRRAGRHCASMPARSPCAAFSKRHSASQPRSGDGNPATQWQIFSPPDSPTLPIHDIQIPSPAQLTPTQ